MLRNCRLMIQRFQFTLIIGLLLIGLVSCSDDEPACSSGQAIPLDFGSCLVFEDGQLDQYKMAIEHVTRQAVQQINQKMPVADVIIRVRAAPENTIPEIGIGGFNPNEREVIISIDPNFVDLDQTIAVELKPQLAHEMHHAKRRRSVGYGSTLLQALVSEGLADWFSIEVTGIDPPIWSTALSGSELEHWIEEARDGWNNGTYNHAEWFLGTSQEIPRWAGYSIGFKLVQNFLDQNPNRKPSDLFDEPASSFEM